MKLSLICAGLSHLKEESTEGKGSGVFRMPRISMARNTQQFLPDYAMLLLCDELVMGRRTYEGLIRGQIDSTSTLPLMTKLLHDEGFIRLENFDGAITEHQSLLELMIEENLAVAESWVPTMWKSVKSWQSYYEGLQLTLRPRVDKMKKDLAEGRPVPFNYARAASVFVHHMGGRYQMARYFAEEVLAPDGNEPDILKERREFLTEQLAYTVCHLLFSRKFGAGIHDWCDFTPHYYEMIQRCRDRSPDTAAKPAAVELFKLTLPELILWHPNHVIKALRDTRVAELRVRVHEAASGGAPLDAQAAIAALDATCAFESGVSKVRQVTASKLAISNFMNEVPVRAGDCAFSPTVHFSSHSIDYELADKQRLEPKEG